MTLDGFIKKYNGRYLDWDGKFGAQCVDLMRFYLKEVLEVDPYSLPSVGYAKELYLNYSPKNRHFERLPNTPLFVPRPGDVVVWNWRFPVTGVAGHVAIITGADVKHFIAFGQNYGKPNFCRYQNYDYRGVLGFLRKR